MTMSLAEVGAMMKKHATEGLARIEAEGPKPHPLTDEKTRLSYWFPLIRDAGLPVPKTEIITMDFDSHRSMHKDLLNEGKFNEHGEALASQIKAAATRLVGKNNPFFLRTDHTAAKHDWKNSCCVTDWSKLNNHIYQIIEYSDMAGLMGLPTETWAVREMLNTEGEFTAFDDMPIVREFRLFMRDGTCLHTQGYWPPDAIRRPSVKNWKEIVDRNNRITLGELSELHGMAKLANVAVPGYWSVDFLQTKDRGWVLTDMAEGEKSFSWQPEQLICDR